MKRNIEMWLIFLSLLLVVGCSLQCNAGTPSPQPAWTVIPTEEVVIENTPMLAETQSEGDGYLIEAVHIPAGNFLMGSEAEIGLEVCEKSRPGCEIEDFEDESPVREVILDDFWIDRFEVTNANFQLCVEDGVCDLPALLEFYNHPDFDDHPVVYVSWVQAEQFCEWAGGRLPTEAEWEKAARGEDERIFPWGNDLSCGNANLKGCTQGLTMPVGSFPDGASPFGVLDMAGNAAEWVADWYDPSGYDLESLDNPAGPDEGELKTARGGSWKNPFSGVRSTNRTANYPEVFSSGVGFRCTYDQQP